MDEQRNRDAPEEKVRLFISHSHEDRELANALASLINSALLVRPRTMRCTSDYRFNLVPGDDIAQELRRDLANSDVVIGLLTPSSLASSYVFLELGVAWGLGRRVIAVFVAGLDFQHIPEPISRLHCAPAYDPRQMEKVLHTVCRECGMDWRTEGGTLLEPMNVFLEQAKRYSSMPRSRSGSVDARGSVDDLGNFSAFLPRITEAIEAAPDSSEIRIACDYVGYGMFNAGEESDKYRNALVRAGLRGCAIKMLILGSDPWNQMRTQVSTEDEREFTDQMGLKEFKEKLDAFEDRLTKLGLGQPGPWTRAGQLEALVRVELRYEEMLRASGIQITIVCGPLPLHLWITESTVLCAIVPLQPRDRFHRIDWDLAAMRKYSEANPFDERGLLFRDEENVQRFRYVWRQYL